MVILIHQLSSKVRGNYHLYTHNYNHNHNYSHSYNHNYNHKSRSMHRSCNLSNQALPAPPLQPPPVRQRKQPSKRLHRSHSLSVTPSMPFYHNPTSKEAIEALKHEAFLREHQRQQRESEQQRRQI
ncbi:hypothetical protein BGZ81_005725 [Podila clonocystis]|nr:hypothetical protein BGZ81_005725 [Podila clonocystis]